MGRLDQNQERLFYSFCLDEVVPDDHLVRQIAAVLDLSWVHAELHFADADDRDAGPNLYSAGAGGQSAAWSRIRRRWRSFMISTQVTNDIATTLAPIMDGLAMTMP